MSVHKVLEPLLEKLHSTANIKTIYGEPIKIEGKTIIPVAKVMYGLGGGFGKAKTKNKDGLVNEKPAGESGGGGIRIVPVGLVEISEGRTQFLAFRQSKILGIIFLLIAFLAGFLIGEFF